MSEELAYIIGYGYATIVGALAIFPLMWLMWAILRSQATAAGKLPNKKRTHIDPALQPNFWQTATIGILERALYLASLQMDRPEFVAVWLGIKTVAQSKSWTEKSPVPGRAVYNNFLVGNGLSLLYATIGVGIIRWTVGPTWIRNNTLAIIAASSPILFSIPLGIILYIVLRRTKRAIPKSKITGQRSKSTKKAT